MKIWHKDLIPVLPNRMLIGQFRQLCDIARDIMIKGKTGNPFVDRVNDFPELHLYFYAMLVREEIEKRGYYCEWKKLERWIPIYLTTASKEVPMNKSAIFAEGWHNDRYFEQCYYSLQEMYDCGKITSEEMQLIDCERANRTKKQ